ncbi:MAG TPA: RDD family protein [Terriglobales bacterium]|nr:RDD family protein [Terriglobales bacterium]
MNRTQANPYILANWGRRLIAWFIDYLIVNIMIAYVGLENLESQLIPSILLPSLPGYGISVWSPLSILIFFVYWTLCEWYFGRSIGQLLLNLRLVNVKGDQASLASAALQSVGKSLLLPMDCLIGWVYPPCRPLRQRLFNRLSNTIVIYLGKPMQTEAKDGLIRET